MLCCLGHNICKNASPQSQVREQLACPCSVLVSRETREIKFPFCLAGQTEGLQSGTTEHSSALYEKKVVVFKVVVYILPVVAKPNHQMLSSGINSF